MKERQSRARPVHARASTQILLHFCKEQRRGEGGQGWGGTHFRDKIIDSRGGLSPNVAWVVNAILCSLAPGTISRPYAATCAQREQLTGGPKAKETDIHTQTSLGESESRPHLGSKVFVLWSLDGVIPVTVLQGAMDAVPQLWGIVRGRRPAAAGP